MANFLHKSEAALLYLLLTKLISNHIQFNCHAAGVWEEGD